MLYFIYYSVTFALLNLPIHKAKQTTDEEDLIATHNKTGSQISVDDLIRIVKDAGIEKKSELVQYIKNFEGLETQVSRPTRFLAPEEIRTLSDTLTQIQNFLSEKYKENRTLFPTSYFDWGAFKELKYTLESNHSKIYTDFLTKPPKSIQSDEISFHKLWENDLNNTYRSNYYLKLDLLTKTRLVKQKMKEFRLKYPKFVPICNEILNILDNTRRNGENYWENRESLKKTILVYFLTQVRQEMSKMKTPKVDEKVLKDCFGPFYVILLSDSFNFGNQKFREARYQPLQFTVDENLFFIHSLDYICDRNMMPYFSFGGGFADLTINDLEGMDLQSEMSILNNEGREVHVAALLIIYRPENESTKEKLYSFDSEKKCWINQTKEMLTKEFLEELSADKYHKIHAFCEDYEQQDHSPIPIGISLPKGHFLMRE